MALTVSMPQLGESVTEGTIARWLKQPGEPVARYESIAEVASDKVNAEIPAPADGTFGEIIAAEGSVVSVGQPICTIEQGAAASAEQPAVSAPEVAIEAAPAVREAPPAAAPAPVAVAPAPAAAPLAPGATAPAPSVPAISPAATAVADADGAAHQHVTPAVRMLAREQGVDLSLIEGSGIGGRVTKKDVLDHVQRRDEAARAAGPAPSGAAAVALSSQDPAPAPAGLAPIRQ